MRVAPARGFPRVEREAGRRACVAVALVPDHDGEGFVLTTRSTSLRTHAAQFALPGGMSEPGEEHVETAVRETEEEIGVDRKMWSVVDVLDDFPLGRTTITPVVIRASQRPDFRPNASEVSAVHVVRVPDMVPDLMWIPGWSQPGDAPDAAPAQAVRLDQFEMYAPTGAIVWQFLWWYLRAEVRRVADIAPPVFARP